MHLMAPLVAPKSSELTGDTKAPLGRVPWSPAGLIGGFSSYPQACILYLSLRYVAGRKSPLLPALDLSIACPALGLGFWQALLLMCMTCWRREQAAPLCGEATLAGCPSGFGVCR